MAINRKVISMKDIYLGRTIFCAAVFCVSVSLVGVLGGGGLAHGEDTSSITSPRVYQYTVRGQIRQLPKSPSGELFIRHEPIPEYVGRDGTVVGMRAMTMPFWLAEEVSVEGLSVGDTVEFVMRSQWEPKAKDTIIALKKIDELAH
jgi:Cu/Ag efflux protein CusF